MNILVTGGIQPKFGRQFVSGRLMAPDGKDGKFTFEHYLEERYSI